MTDTRDSHEKDAVASEAGRPEAEPHGAGDDGGGQLRRRAEEHLDRLVVSYASADATPTREDLAAAVHELRVHQIELEMQNEELRRAQLELDAQRAMYFELFDLAPVGYVTVNAAGIVSQANLTAASLFGVDRAALLGAPLSRFVAADGEDAYYLSMRQLTSVSQPQDFELRFRRGDLAFWASVQARPRPASVPSAGPEYCLTFVDTDELKLARETTRSMAERLAAVIESSYDIIYTIGADGVFLFVSPSWERQLGHDPSFVIGRPFEEFIHPDDVRRYKAVLAEVVADAAVRADIEYRARCADGTWHWFESTLAPEFNALGEVVEYVGNARDITEHKFDLARMQAMAMTDELTGIGNRRQFLTAAATEFDRSRRHGYDLSLLLTDMDRLKDINDSFGHDTGDSALQIVAEICRDVGRGADAAGRLGGDEFAILLPHSSGSAAFEVGERLRRRIESEPCDGRLPGGLALTVSVGLSAVRPDDPDYTSVLKRADRALYRAKQTGRNRTCM